MEIAEKHRVCVDALRDFADIHRWLPPDIGLLNGSDARAQPIGPSVDPVAFRRGDRKDGRFGIEEGLRIWVVVVACGVNGMAVGIQAVGR